MKRIIFAIVVMLFFQSTNAQTYLNSKDELTEHSEKVMEFLNDSEFQKAFTELQNYWPLPENEVMQLESQTIKQFNMIAERFGNIIGFDFIRDEAIKDYAHKKIYVLRFEKHMIRVLFTYYNNNDGWILNGFKWDDQFGELFE